MGRYRDCEKSVETARGKITNVTSYLVLGKSHLSSMTMLRIKRYKKEKKVVMHLPGHNIQFTL